MINIRQDLLVPRRIPEFQPLSTVSRFVFGTKNPSWCIVSDLVSCLFLDWLLFLQAFFCIGSAYQEASQLILKKVMSPTMHLSSSGPQKLTLKNQLSNKPLLGLYSGREKWTCFLYFILLAGVLFLHTAVTMNSENSKLTSS